MNPLSIKTHFIASVVVAGVAAAATWQIQSWRCEARVAAITKTHRSELGGRDELLQNIQDEASRQLQAQQRERQKQAKRLTALDTQHYQELRNAQKETDRLRADLSAGRRRLYVDTTPNQDSTRSDSVLTGTSTSRLDDGTVRAALHPTIAGRLVDIAGGADECSRKLTGLQDWVKAQRLQ